MDTTQRELIDALRQRLQAPRAHRSVPRPQRHQTVTPAPEPASSIAGAGADDGVIVLDAPVHEATRAS